MKYLSFCFLLIFTQIILANELRIEAIKSPFHVGKTVMACGVLAQVKKSTKQIYLNLDKPYPDQSLTLLIWANKYDAFNKRFGDLDRHTNKKVCARGTIKEYKHSLQIVLNNPQFLRIMD